jgi:hypothetical protein
LLNNGIHNVARAHFGSATYALFGAGQVILDQWSGLAPDCAQRSIKGTA